MGSRSRRNAALVAAGALTALASAGCTAGPPPGFSAGTHWVIPLVGPLEDELLLVPALVNGKGPYVFAIDTDAKVSGIDQEVMEDIAPRTGEGPKLLDESDTERDRFYAEILEWQLGTLTVKNKPAQIVPARTFDIEGRRIHGVIGRDILADSLTFGFDRDAGEIHLTTHAAYKAPPDAISIGFSTLTNQIKNAEVLPLSRKLVDAKINGESFRVHLDFGAMPNQLRQRSWERAKLVESPTAGSVVDEVGTPRKITKQGLAEVVAVGAASVMGTTFIPFDDKRWPDQDLEGTLGLGFFKPYDVTVDWDTSKVYLRPRSGLGDTAQRISRWQSKTLSGCAQLGCVKINLIDPTATMPEANRPATHPGVVASITREPAASRLDLEVLVAVTAKDGKTPLKWLVINMPSGTDRTFTHLSADYVGAITTVLDASPFPRTCPAVGGCIDLLTAPQAFVPPPAPVAPPTEAVPPPPTASGSNAPLPPPSTAPSAAP